MARLLWTTLATLLVASLCATWFHLARDRGRDRVVDIDEGEWLSISIYTYHLVSTGEARDAGAPRRGPEADPWREGIQESTFGWMNPIFGKLVFGAVAVRGGHEVATRDVFPRFTKDRPNARGRALARYGPALRGGRGVALALAALGGGLLFLVGLRAHSVLAAVIAPLIWCASPAARAAAGYVRTDLFPVAFGLGALALAIAASGALAGRRGVARAALAGAGLGLLAGLAAGSKLNGAVTAAVVAAAAPVAWALAPREGRALLRGPVVAALTAGAVCLALVCLSLPAAWRANPAAGLVETVDAWSAATDVQQRKFAQQGYAVADTPDEHVALAARGVLGREEPLRALTGLPLGAPLLALGLVVLAAGCRAGPRRVAAALALTWVLVTGAVQTLWLPIDWERYFLPYQPVLVLLEAVAIAAVLGWILRRVRGGRPAPAPD